MNIVLQGFGNENCMSLRSSQAASWMHKHFYSIFRFGLTQPFDDLLLSAKKRDAYQPHVSFHISYIPLQMIRTWLFNEGACGA